MKLVPKPHMLKSIRSRNWNLAGAVEELVDNSLGHGKARNVKVLIDNAAGIAVIDDGVGIDDINRVFRFGDASAHDDLSEIGQYGVGAKNATIYLGDLVRVDTVHDGRKHSMSVDWGEVERSGEWPDAYSGKGTKAKPGDPGTRVLVAKLARRYQLSTSEKLARELGQVFAPAVRKGTAIHVWHSLTSGENQLLAVEPFNPSDMISEIDIGGEVHTGRGPLRWKGHAGLSASLTERFNGVHIAFGHRIIETTREPFYGESAPTLYCEVVLDETTPWKHALSEHKDKVVRHRADLIDSIHTALKSLIDESAQQASYLALKGMTVPIETQLTKAFKGAGILHVDPDEEPEEGGGFGDTDTPVTPGKRLRTPMDEGDPAKEAGKPTGVQIAFRERHQLEGQLYSWEINGKQMLITLDADEFKPVIGYPPQLRDRHVLHVVTAFLSHAIEMEYWNSSLNLVRVLTPKLRKQLDAWASEPNKIAPYLNRVILEGVER